MLDTIELKITPQMVSLKEWREIESNFKVQSSHYYHDSSTEYRKRYLNNINVTSSAKSYTIRGSLSKFLYENNCYSLSYEDIKTALRILEDTLEIPLKKAKVTRIDFASNLLMKHPPECYINHLLDIEGFNRFDNKSTLSFKGKNTEISFYNKVREKRNKFNAVPKAWKDENILRYELRLKNNIDYIFETTVTVANLFDEGFYIQLWEKWAEMYYKIKTTQKVYINLMNCNKPKDFEDQILRFGYMAYGIANALEDVKQLRQLKRFKNDYQYSKLKAKINGLVNQNVITPSNELINELDAKIEQAILYYR